MRGGRGSRRRSRRSTQIYRAERPTWPPGIPQDGGPRLRRAPSLPTRHPRRQDLRPSLLGSSWAIGSPPAVDPRILRAWMLAKASVPYIRIVQPSRPVVGCRHPAIAGYSGTAAEWPRESGSRVFPWPLCRRSACCPRQGRQTARLALHPAISVDLRDLRLRTVPVRPTIQVRPRPGRGFCPCLGRVRLAFLGPGRP